MNHYKDSSGNSWTTAQINRKFSNVASLKFKNQIVEHGYNFCEECKRNASNTKLDPAHIVSIKKAKETGRAELCWDINNLRILCRKCHQDFDKLNLRFEDNKAI